MAAHGEIQWPPVGSFSGRLWGDFHGRRHTQGWRGGVRNSAAPRRRSCTQTRHQQPTDQPEERRAERQPAGTVRSSLGHIYVRASVTGAAEPSR